MINVPTMASTQAMAHADRLIQHLRRLPSTMPSGSTYRRRPSTVVDHAGGEDAGEDRAQRSARAVHAEGIERIVIAELVLSPRSP